MGDAAAEEGTGGLFGKFYKHDEISVLKPKKEQTKDFSAWPPNVVPDPGKWTFWLPEGWGQGIKTTSGGKSLKTYVNPNGKMYYHKPDIEKVLGYKLASQEPPDDTIGPNANVNTAVPSWPGGDWLPQDWRIAYRKLPGRLHRVYIPPNQEEGFCYHRSDVERYLCGERSRLSPIGSSKLQTEKSKLAAARDEKAGVASPSKAGRSPGGQPRAKRARLDGGPRAVAQTGWAACLDQAAAKEAVGKFRELLKGSNFGAAEPALVALHGLQEGHRYATWINGVYFELPGGLPGRPPRYQKLVSAPASVAGVGCDAVYIGWDARRKQWCVGNAAHDNALPYACCDGLPQSPSFAEQALASKSSSWSWQVASDDVGETFAAEPSLAVLGVSPGAAGSSGGGVAAAAAS